MRRGARGVAAAVVAGLLLLAPGPFAHAAGPWFDGSRPTAPAWQALRLLDEAASHGLDPADYDAEALRQRLDAATQAGEDERAALGLALGESLRRYLSHLHDGRAAATYPRVARAAPWDADEALHAALALQDLSLAVRAATPPLAQYERLREALAATRALIGHAAWQSPLPALPTAHAGSVASRGWTGWAIVEARLAAWGDLDAAAAPAPASATDARAAALRTFQRRHGLEPDARLGTATHAALAVPPAARARQIELALERLRGAPLRAGPRMIVVNLPEFVLRAYEVSDARIEVRATMKVIVGQALDTRTPLIAEDLRRIEFQPHWNVPRSIAAGELVPSLSSDRAAWTREGFEFVDPRGAADPAFDEAKLQAVLDGRLRLRQRPGPRNALGAIKFVFPNRASIYLHHTPAVGLFARARRDFSHGCIRVEDPVALAAFALQGQAGWDAARVRAAMADGAPSRVTLARPLPVLIVYITTLVKDGRVHFFDDLYGHDRALDAALQSQRARRTAQ